MPDIQSIGSASVAQLPAEADIHSLPREMVQEILEYLDLGDLEAFATSQALRGAIDPYFFNCVARRFIEKREQTLPSRPWSSSAITRCYASVREQFKGSDEEFARLYPDSSRLKRIHDVSRWLDRLSSKIQSRVSCCDVPIVDPTIHSPITTSSEDEPAFLMVGRSGKPSLVTLDGVISSPPALSNCCPLMRTGPNFPVVNSMHSRGDGELLVINDQPVQGMRELYRPLAGDFLPLPPEFQQSVLCALSENGQFIAAVVWFQGQSRLLVYELKGLLSKTDKTLNGNIESLSVDSRGVALIYVHDDEAKVGGQPTPHCGYEVQPGGAVGPPVVLIGDRAPGYILAPGEDAVILNGPETGDLTLRSRYGGGALTLRPRDSGCVPVSMCMGPAKASAVATYSTRKVANDPADKSPAALKQYVGVFDLTSVSGDQAEAVLPKVWYELQDSSLLGASSAACLTRDASRLTLAYLSRTEEVKLVNVDLSPAGSG